MLAGGPPTRATCGAAQAMKSIFEDEAKDAADREAEALRERELAAVSINDVRADSLARAAWGKGVGKRLLSGPAPGRRMCW